MFQARSAGCENLICRDDYMTTKAVGIEVHVNFGIERSREIALDHHASEALLAPNLHLWPELLVPVQLNCVICHALTTNPRYGNVARGDRKRAELGGIDRDLGQR